MHFISGTVLLLIGVLLFSCNLDDFNLNKLAATTNIVPKAFAPLAYGTFKVSDFTASPAPADNTPVPVAGLDLSPLIISKLGTTFSNAALDSIYLITLFTNNTPCVMEFELSFLDNSGTQMGKLLLSGPIPVGAIESKIKFPLGPIDQTNLQKAALIQMDFKLFPPASGTITYGVAKTKSFTTKLSFYAPVTLQNL